MYRVCIAGSVNEKDRYNCVVSFPGPAQLFVTCCMTESWASLVPRPRPAFRRLQYGLANFLQLADYVMLTWEKIPGSPRFSVLQATESWVGPGNEAMEPSCSWSEASGVVDMALLCCRSVLQRTWQTTEEKRKHTIKHDRARCACEIAAWAKEHKLGKPRTKDGAWRTACVAARVAMPR